MKKLKKVLALTSAFMLLSSVYFTSCAGDDDDENNNGTPTTSKSSDNQPEKDSGNPSSGGETATAYTVSFTGENSNGNTSSYENGVYTITVANANTENWQNQIFIKNPNTAAGLVAGDKIHATITAKADKTIEKFVFKDQFNGGTYSGIDNLTSLEGLEANVAKKFDIYGTVTSDYDTSSSYVIDLRGNEAGTTLVLSEIKVEKLGNYTPSELKIKANSTSVSVGETVTFTTTDQYGFTLEGITYEIVSANSVSTLSGTVLTAGNTAETVTVKATLGDLTKTIDITVTSNKDYGKYFTAEGASSNGEDAAKGTPGYLFLWSQNTLSDVTASEKEYAFTRSSKSEWWGTQVFYAAEKGKYAVTFNVTSSVAGKITVNNTDYELSADTAKKIAFIKELAGTDTLISVQLGVNGVGPIDEGTFKISDFSVTEITNLDLSTVTVESVEISPVAKTISAGEKVTFSAKINDLYPVEATYSITSEEGISGSAINGAELTAGTPTGETGTVKVTATYGGKTSEAAVVTVKSASVPVVNLVTEVSFKKMFQAYGDTWTKNVDNVETVTNLPEGVNFSVNGTTVKFNLLNASTADYQGQLFLNTNANLAVGDEWEFSCKLLGVDGNYKIKLNDSEVLIPMQSGTFTAAGTEVSFESPKAVEEAANNIVLFFDFAPCAAGEITISNIKLVKKGGNSENSGNTGSTTIDWSTINFLVSDGARHENQYKASGDVKVVTSVQRPAWEGVTEDGIYIECGSGISACSLGTDKTNFYIQGAGILLYLSNFTAKETTFTITDTTGAHNVTVFYADGTDN